MISYSVQECTIKFHFDQDVSGNQDTLCKMHIVPFGFNQEVIINLRYTYVHILIRYDIKVVFTFFHFLL